MTKKGSSRRHKAGGRNLDRVARGAEMAKRTKRQCDAEPEWIVDIAARVASANDDDRIVWSVPPRHARSGGLAKIVERLNEMGTDR